MNNLYLRRYAWPGPILKEKPSTDTEIIIVIPCYFEKDIFESLESLRNCRPVRGHVEVIVVVNHSEAASLEIKAFNRQTAEDVLLWENTRSSTDISFHVIKAFDLPKKQAGVGLARKIGLDEGVRRFESIGNKRGILVWFDADSLCTPNYLREIYKLFCTNTKANSASAYFEHPLTGEEDPKVYDAIINYELHLRYFKNALKYASFPYAFHTVGSCISHTSEVYQKHGGMNTKKAGEDFYFLQKVFLSGGMFNINSAVIIPSPRPSVRVPFGTGRAVSDMLEKKRTSLKTYNPKSFIDFKVFIEHVPAFFAIQSTDEVISGLPKSFQEYSEKSGFIKSVQKIKKNCRTEFQFRKSFYAWFNGFSALKYVHFARDHFYEDIDVLDGANWVLSHMTERKEPAKSPLAALRLLRNFDKSDQIK